VGRFLELFGGRSLETVLGKARQRLASGDFDEAHRIVEAGLMKFPEAEALRETELTIRRAQARAGMQSLKERIARERDPQAYEQLIQLYLEVDMPEEALRETRSYAQIHPDRDTPHLLLGEIHLQSYFEDLLARDAHSAHDHLVRAARLNAEAVKPRLLLAELYFCVGADRALNVLAQSLERFAEADETLRPVIQAIREIKAPDTQESIDGIFERIEVKGALVREASAWPIRNRRNRGALLTEERTRTAAKGVVKRGDAEEVVVLRRGGGLLAHAVEDPTAGGVRLTIPEGDEQVPDAGLVGVARTVARSVAPRAREFDLGAFKRCTVQGVFGTIVVGEVGGTVVGARSRSREPLRLWERVTIGMEGEAGGRKS
jgi:hypothetical protein